MVGSEGDAVTSGPAMIPEEVGAATEPGVGAGFSRFLKVVAMLGTCDCLRIVREDRAAVMIFIREQG